MAKGTSSSRGRDLNIHIVHLPEEDANEPVIVGPISMLGDSIIAEEAFEYLDAPIVRIASVDAPVPYAPPLEAAFLPSVEKVVAGAKKLVEY